MINSVKDEANIYWGFDNLEPKKYTSAKTVTSLGKKQKTMTFIGEIIDVQDDKIEDKNNALALSSSYFYSTSAISNNTNMTISMTFMLQEDSNANANHHTGHVLTVRDTYATCFGITVMKGNRLGIGYYSPHTSVLSDKYINLNEWYNITLRKTGTLLELFCNGKLILTTTYANASTSSTTISSYYTGNGSIANSTFNRAYTQLFVFERALSDEDIDIISNICLKRTLIKSNNKIYSLKLKEILHETNMTSNTAPSPFVASASSVYSSTYPAWKAFDGDIYTSNNGWVTESNVKTGWIQIDFGSEKEVNFFKIFARNGSDVKQLPKDFKLLCSDNGVIFSEIKSFNDITDWIQGEMKTFTIPKILKHRYYRIEILSNNGGSYTAIGEIQFGYREQLTQLPSNSLDIFLNYGIPYVQNFNLVNTSKNYILQNTVSENTDGLLVQDVDRKPLSIKFE